MRLYLLKLHIFCETRIGVEGLFKKKWWYHSYQLRTRGANDSCQLRGLSTAAGGGQTDDAYHSGLRVCTQST